MRALLCVMNARNIPDCMDSYRALSGDVAYMTGYTVRELVDVHADIVRNTDYDAYINVSDDCIVTQEAVDAVVDLLATGHPAATGWCRLRVGHTFVNLSKSPLTASPPRKEDYHFYSYGQVRRHPDEIVPTHFMGMSLTGLTRDMWRRFPYGCYTTVHERGHQSDAHLSIRLEEAGVPMVASRTAYVEHVKERPKGADWRGTGVQRLLVGEVEQKVTITSTRRFR
jgi:hypothetical protein